MEETKIELQLIKLSEIQSQEVSWLWFPFIPYGKLTIIQGDPGDGKTTFVLNIAAKLSKEEGLDSEMKLTEPLNVIYQSAEDGLADTVKPRLEQAKAGCDKDGRKAADFRPDTSLFRRRYGYEPGKRSKGYDEEISGTGREIPVCDCPCRSHEQGGRK